MSSVEKWLTGITTLAIVATIFSSPYAASIITSGGNAVGTIYQRARK